MDSGWRFSVPDAHTLAMWAGAGRLHWWRERAGLLAYSEDEDERQRLLGIAFAACDIDALGDLLRETGRLAQHGGFASVRWLAPVNADVQAALASAGFALDWESSGYLYAKQHPGQ